ncbi:YihA family ribosome biogenesis GTP-binding protein, partial [Lactococcus lactis]|nr:YihA family ribosome biogenesis GTP-binding protein [Lactococcus lactis]
WNKHESIIKKAMKFDSTDDFIIFSSTDKTGFEEAWEAILRYL